MLQPSPSDPQPPTDDGVVRPARRAPAAVVTLDPSWRAGRKLEEARKQLGLSLEEVSDRIRVRKEFLEGLEAMNAKVLPGKAYALAYLKSYAQVLGLDDKAILEQFQEECALSREDAQPQIRSPDSRPHPERPWLAALAVMVVAAGFIGWRAMQAGEPPGEEAQAPISASAPAIGAGGAFPGAEHRVVEIRALADGWLEARGPDGTVFLSRTLTEGDVYRPDPSPGWTLHARDGGLFEVFVDGVSAGPLGTPGMPVLGRPIDSIQPEPAAPMGAGG